jgi:hypothetical protein
VSSDERDVAMFGHFRSRPCEWSVLLDSEPESGQLATISPFLFPSRPMPRMLRRDDMFVDPEVTQTA